MLVVVVLGALCFVREAVRTHGARPPLRVLFKAAAAGGQATASLVFTSISRYPPLAKFDLG